MKGKINKYTYPLSTLASGEYKSEGGVSPWEDRQEHKSMSGLLERNNRFLGTMICGPEVIVVPKQAGGPLFLYRGMAQGEAQRGP